MPTREPTAPTAAAPPPPTLTRKPSPASPTSGITATAPPEHQRRPPPPPPPAAAGGAAGSTVQRAVSSTSAQNSAAKTMSSPKEIITTADRKPVYPPKVSHPQQQQQQHAFARPLIPPQEGSKEAIRRQRRQHQYEEYIRQVELAKSQPQSPSQSHSDIQSASHSQSHSSSQNKHAESSHSTTLSSHPGLASPKRRYAELAPEEDNQEAGIISLSASASASAAHTERETPHVSPATSSLHNLQRSAAESSEQGAARKSSLIAAPKAVDFAHPTGSGSVQGSSTFGSGSASSGTDKPIVTPDHHDNDYPAGVRRSSDASVTSLLNGGISRAREISEALLKKTLGGATSFFEDPSHGITTSSESQGKSKLNDSRSLSSSSVSHSSTPSHANRDIAVRGSSNEGSSRSHLPARGARGVAILRDQWKPDSQAERCDDSRCESMFSLTVRRHHCRVCGQVFCERHSSFALPLYHPSPAAPGRRGKVSMSRVCEGCFDQVVKPPLPPPSTTRRRSAEMTTHSSTSGFMERLPRRTEKRRMFSLPPSPASRSPPAPGAMDSSMPFSSSTVSSSSASSSASVSRRLGGGQGAAPRSRISARSPLARTPAATLSTGSSSISEEYFDQASVVVGPLAAYPLAYKNSSTPNNLNHASSVRSFAAVVGSTSGPGQPWYSGAVVPRPAGPHRSVSSASTTSFAAHRRGVNHNLLISDMPSPGILVDVSPSSGQRSTTSEWVPQQWGYDRKTFDPELDASDDEDVVVEEDPVVKAMAKVVVGEKEQQESLGSKLVVDGDFRLRASPTNDSKRSGEIDGGSMSNSMKWATF